MTRFLHHFLLGILLLVGAMDLDPHQMKDQIDTIAEELYLSGKLSREVAELHGQFVALVNTVDDELARLEEIHKEVAEIEEAMNNEEQKRLEIVAKAERAMAAFRLMPDIKEEIVEARKNQLLEEAKDNATDILAYQDRLVRLGHETQMVEDSRSLHRGAFDRMARPIYNFFLRCKEAADSLPNEFEFDRFGFMKDDLLTLPITPPDFEWEQVVMSNHQQPSGMPVTEEHRPAADFCAEKAVVNRILLVKYSPNEVKPFNLKDGYKFHPHVCFASGSRSGSMFESHHLSLPNQNLSAIRALRSQISFQFLLASLYSHTMIVVDLTHPPPNGPPYHAYLQAYKYYAKVYMGCGVSNIVICS